MDKYTMLVRPATAEELGDSEVDQFWLAFADSKSIPRKFRGLAAGHSVTCSEAEHDELMEVVRHLPGRHVRPLRVWS